MIHRNLQHGYILLPVVIMLTLVAAVAFMLNNESALDSGITASNQEMEQAEYVAQAGLNHALWQTQQQGCGPYSDLTNKALGKDSYTTTLTTDLGSTNAYTIAVDQDAWIRNDLPASNNATDSKLHIRFEGGTIERPMYRYDLSAIPSNDSILSARAWFYVSKEHPQGPVDIHRLNADWTETDATWDTMGANMDSTVLASIPAQPAAGVWVAVNLTAQVQAWVNGEPNFGITLNSTSEGTHGDYASREAAQQPYLEVVVGTSPSSPARLKSQATLASGIVRTMNWNDIRLHQQPAYRMLQLRPGAGKDAMLSGFYNNRNYGDHRLRVSVYGSLRNSLVQFDLAGLPVGARVLSARLQLYHTDTTRADADAGASVHRVTRDWVEGTQSGGGTADGVTWNTWDGSNAWATAGGDYDPAPMASHMISAATGDWESWDITALAQGWLDGSFDNHGLLLKGSGNVSVDFASREDADPMLRPKLDISYACECGSPCLAPQGSGAVLMVVVNPTMLVSGDAYKKALFESWGYTVTVVGESENQASYDAAIAAADVVFISETVNANQVGTKLADVAIGVVSQDGSYNSALGFALGSAWPVASDINVTDTGHYITAVFPSGPLQIYAESMEQLTVSGTGAAELQTLADTGGAGSLVVLDKGAIGTGGNPLAGRRVMLPLGREAGMNWDYLNASGRLLLHRALQWGMGADLAAPPQQLLFVSGGNFNDPLVTPTAQEQLRIDLIESWGYAVTLIHASQLQADFDTALATSDVAYVSSAVTEAELGTKLKEAAIGVVNEQGELVDEFGFGQQSLTYKTRNEIDVIDNTHYITEPFATGLLTIVSADQSLHLMTANKAPGFTAIAQVFNTGSLWDDAMGTIDSGGELFGGGNAAGRRVLLPWGEPGFDVASLNADGQVIMQRAIEWAEGKGSSPAPAYNVLLVVAEAGTPSSADADRKALIEGWDHMVTLIDDSDSQANFDAAAAAADVAYITESVVLMELAKKLKAATIGVVNEDPALHDVFGFSTNRLLSSGNPPMATDAAHYITSPFGGAAVTLFGSSQPLGAAVGTLPSGLDIIGTWSSGTMSSLGGLLTLETGASISGGGTAAGRRVQLPWGGQDGVSIADVNALTADGLSLMQRALMWAAGAGSGGGGSGPAPTCAATFADDFETQDYTGSTGSLAWLTDWLEVNESDGPGGGDEKVVSHAGDLAGLLKDNGPGNSGEGLERGANLSGYAAATLTFTYWRDLGNNDSVVVEVSNNGGGNWVQLDLYQGSATDADANPQSANYDITAYISPDTRIRFMTGATNGNNDGMYVDDVEICVTD